MTLTPREAVVFAFGPDPDAPPMWWFLPILTPGALALAYLLLRRVLG